MKIEIKKIEKTLLAVLVSIVLCIPSALVIFYFTKPMEDKSYNLSLIAEDGQEWEGEKGWTVYTDEKGKKNKLASDGSGGYSGLDYLGQTFYFSRKLTEELDSPTLTIGAVNRTVSVFLDDDLIYTDCPELDNRIGYLTLPMLDYDREDPVKVSLPPDYLGRTLTIAQASPEFSEKQNGDTTVFPCRVRLYCGYAYESSLIASTAKIMLPAVLLFALELFLLAVFIWNVSRKNFIIQLPVFALAVFFQICSILSEADFFYQYFGTPSIDPTWLFFHLSVGALLLFLTLYARSLRPLFLVATTIQWISIILYFISQSGLFLEYGYWYVFLGNLPQFTGFITLFAALTGSFWLWRKEDRFFRRMSHNALFLIIGYALFLVVTISFSPDYVTNFFAGIMSDIRMLLPNFSLKLIWDLCLFSSLIAVIANLLEQETEYRTELAILDTKNKLAVESYENLRLQSEEVHMLRHDTMKHYSLLRTMAKDTPERVGDYLDELIEQVENVRPVVSSKNQILNILLNGKLNVASAEGISTEIIRSDAPEKLPLSDKELCCLVANILDNAINAASDPETGTPYIKLDFHCKEQHFVFSCTNSMPENHRDKKTPTPEHGYGLKIIRQIMSRFGDNMLSIEQTKTVYKITVVLPLTS